ncbi:MAG: NAD(P)/FAD-dependent oxidoreductase [Rhodobacteraceae bacterium]|nr:NAD(P)/FAD-dependent oxidoreductase [Paracoccaceae bacterium]
MKNTYDTIIIGAGAAGLMCALTAGQRGLRVLLLDHADKAGKKILISGGGRCNFTNTDTRPECYLSQNKHFAKSALSRYTANDFLALVERHNIAWHEKTLGQLFCDVSAKQILAMLLAECADGNVEISLGHKIDAIRYQDDEYLVKSNGKIVSAPSLVIATGGPSIPKMGATSFAYEIARQFGLKIVEPTPALVPFTLSHDEQLFRALSGVSTDVIARCGKVEFREAALFTHKGLSGPAILQISSYWKQGQSIGIDFLPDQPSGWLIEAKSTRPRSHFRAVLGQHLPDRLTQALAERINLVGELANQSDKVLTEIEGRLSNWLFTPTGTEGFAKAEVALGGIDTNELSSKTMEAKSQPGLYFIGEAVDVTGWLGGYNFQWAWASGWAAGQVV